MTSTAIVINTMSIIKADGTGHEAGIHAQFAGPGIGDWQVPPVSPRDTSRNMTIVRRPSSSSLRQVCRLRAALHFRRWRR